MAEKLLPLPLQFPAAWIEMWVGEHQARVIEYQRAENAALLERLGKHQLRLADGERRCLQKLGNALGRKALQEVATLATPNTVLRWYRELVAAKYDRSKRHGPVRPKKAAEIQRVLLEMAKRTTSSRACTKCCPPDRSSLLDGFGARRAKSCGRSVDLPLRPLIGQRCFCPASTRK